MSYTYMKYEEYMASDVWRCKDSPTGGHHWIERRIDGLSKGQFYCKWCYDARHFPVTYAEALGGKKIPPLVHMIVKEDV